MQIAEEPNEPSKIFSISPIKKEKVPVPKLKIPLISSETPLESRDDLNNAIIFNSGFTEKSESPFLI